VYAAKLRFKYELQLDSIIIVTFVNEWNDYWCRGLLFGTIDHEDESTESNVESKSRSNIGLKSEYAEHV
jgi:hypothetical protein